MAALDILAIPFASYATQGNWTLGSDFVSITENPYKPVDGARQIVLRTTLEQFEHLPGRIRGGNTSEEPLWDRYSDLFEYFWFGLHGI